MSPGVSWDYNHKPARRPLGCNGKYGQSGAAAHIKKGHLVCPRCKSSRAHYQRERRRGGIKPRQLQPCGTWAAAQRHRAKDEPLDFACRVAEAEHALGRRKLATKNP